MHFACAFKVLIEIQGVEEDIDAVLVSRPLKGAAEAIQAQREVD